MEILYRLGTIFDIFSFSCFTSFLLIPLFFSLFIKLTNLKHSQMKINIAKCDFSSLLDNLMRIASFSRSTFQCVLSPILSVISIAIYDRME